MRFTPTVTFRRSGAADTTYLERYDKISLLDRPISEPDAAATRSGNRSSNRIATSRPGRRWLVDSPSRLKFPAFTRADGSRKFKDYKDFVVQLRKGLQVGLFLLRLARRGRR